MLASFYSMVRIAQSHKDLYFAGLLTTQDIQKAFEKACKSRGALYNPLTVVTVSWLKPKRRSFLPRSPIEAFIMRLSKSLPPVQPILEAIACSGHVAGRRGAMH